MPVKGKGLIRDPEAVDAMVAVTALFAASYLTLKIGGYLMEIPTSIETAAEQISDTYNVLPGKTPWEKGGWVVTHTDKLKHMEERYTDYYNAKQIELAALKQQVLDGTITEEEYWRKYKEIWLELEAMHKQYKELSPLV